MSTCILLLLACGQSGEVDSKDFAKDAQTAALRATVKVVNLKSNAEGSAVIIKQDGKIVYILSAAHLAKTGDKLEIHTFTAASYPKAAEVYKSAEVVESNKELDVAVIRLITTDPMPGVLPLCPPKKVLEEKDFSALSVGCSRGDAPTCQIETVRHKIKVQRPGEENKTLTWEIAAAPTRGRSGGPLIDKRGLVIGVASGASDDLGYYIHIEEINRFLKNKGLEGLYEEKRK